MSEARYTLPGTRLPEEALPPTLLFHRWQAYDRFERELEIDREGRPRRHHGELKYLAPFIQEKANLPFLSKVAETVQRCGTRYTDWYKRFADACKALEAEPPISATTLWRLVVGWGTNPTLKTGITLDHLLGFPYIPGSAVKGLLHRVAEQELLEARDGAVSIPAAPDTLQAEPPAELTTALARCLRIRALFGSLHLRRGQEGSPEAPFDRLVVWRKLLPEAGKEPESWAEVSRQLARLCSDAPVGGMVTCFDAVPSPDAFKTKRALLTPDVLTPHEPSPNPILFLAVREGITFELRYRLAAWPAADPRDPEEGERSSDLGGIDRSVIAKELQRWLVRGLAELGLGGKTSAGYGYLLAEGNRLPMPKLREAPKVPVEPEEVLSEAERRAREALPKGIGRDPAIAALDTALRERDPAVRAVAARFMELFPDALEGWRTSQRAATRRRVDAIDRLLSGGGENER